MKRRNASETREFIKNPRQNHLPGIGTFVKFLQETAVRFREELLRNALPEKLP